ncbi:MAG: tetratricopeptide repeat protein [Acidobacteria bacterium]|nr:tetratricopeptide repeat protein [Acidobacteriota bacterium]
MTGRVLGHYRILEKIGSGGMGVVYRARDERLERDVALKVLPAGTLADEATRRRFRKEALALSQLNHPNIATVHDFDTQEGVDFLVMEHIPGVTLAEKIVAKPLSEKETIRLATQLAQGLVAAHAEGVVHHDLKPGNLRVTPDGRLKILDFGLAKLFRPASETAVTESLTEAWNAKGASGGTLPYMAPEQLRGEETDARTDIYAAGTVLYEMATGRRPFPQTQGPQLIAAILQQAPTAPRRLDRSISPALENVILKALDKEPERRYQSAKELVVDLQRLSVPAPLIAAPHSHRLMRWTRWAFVAALAVSLALVVATVPAVREPLLAWVGLGLIPGPKNLVVLPFQAIGGGTQNQAYCDGLTETLTAKLAKLTTAHKLQVASASEVRGRRVTSPDQAHKELGVNLALTGSFYYSGKMVRINYSLVDAKTLRQLDADTITLPESDTFAVQDRVAEGVLQMLKVELNPHERRVLASHGTQVPLANDYYLAGRGYLQYYDKLENIENAITVFERALSLDPNYALAYAGLGEAQWKKYERSKETKWVETARQACERALSLDAKLAAAHICLGMLYKGRGQYEKAIVEFRDALEEEPTNDDAYRGLANAEENLGKLDEAEKTYRRAIELRPYYWAGYSWLGAFFISHGRYKEAVEQFEQVVALTPDNSYAYSNLGGACFYVGRYDEAIAAFRKAIELHPAGVYEAYSNLGTTYIALRRFEEAVRVLEEALRLGKLDYRVCGNLAEAYYWAPGKRAQSLEMYARAIRLAQEQLQINPLDGDAQILLASYYAMLGRKTEAFDHMKRALHLQPDNPEFLAHAAVVHNQFGERAAALAWLEKAVARGHSPAQLLTVIELDNLRAEPKFQALIGPK